MENYNNEKLKDKLFEQDFQRVKSFAFDQQVTDVFADMIKRSVPGYDSILRSIAMYTMRYATDNSNIYDIGCSLGAVAITAASVTKDVDCHVYAIDTSLPMVKKCQSIVNNKELGNKISVLQENVTSMSIDNASVIISNFTLQFIPKEQRYDVVKKIYNGLNSGGIFILSEKFKGDENNDEFLIEHYHAYKKINGYSNKEIQAKRQALKDVLMPDSQAEIEKRLKSVGFDNVIKWFQCFNFASFIAVKD